MAIDPPDAATLRLCDEVTIMSVEDPGEFTVTCDKCDESITLASTQYAGDPATWGVDDAELEDAGWVREGDETYCPGCKDGDDDE